MIRAGDAIDDEKINLVAQAIAIAMGHSERWHQYRTVARMQLAGFAACQLVECQPHRGPGRTPTHSMPLRVRRQPKTLKRVLTPKHDVPTYPL